MSRTIGRLTALRVSRLDKPGMHADGGGLYLQISSANAKSWVFRYALNGRSREMGLGSQLCVSLAEARELATDCRRLRQSGVDPIEARRAERQSAIVEAANVITFKEATERYIGAHETGWRNEKHRAQWRSTLETHAYPVIGSLSVAAIDTTLVLKIVQPIWTTTPETASRVRGRIERILNWATSLGYRSGDNPARWKGHLDNLLPKRSKVRAVKHHPALPYDDLPGFMADLRAYDSISARALEFTVLTAARTGAVIGALRSEIDFDAKVWTVPPERTGTKITGENPKPRRVPLSERALEILKALPREDGNPHLFIGLIAGTHLSDMAMLEVMRGLRPGYVPHGFRSTFKDWCSERTNFPNEVSEAALWHVVADKVEAAYRRGDLFEKRRRLMDAWAAFAASRPSVVLPLVKSGPGNVAA